MWTAPAIVVGLLALGIWVYRLDEQAVLENLGAFLPVGLLYTVTLGLGCMWVRSQFPVVGIFLAAVSIPLVFGGVRQLAGYFGFEPTAHMPSLCGVAALGVLWTMTLFSPEFFAVGVSVKTVDVRQLPSTRGGAFQVQGAVPMPDLDVSQSTGGGRKSGPRYTYVVPLAFEGWTPEQPVPAWLICRPGHSFKEECRWEAGVQHVIAPTGLDTEERAGWIQEIERVHSLRSAPGARLLARSEDSREAVLEAIGLGLGLPLGFLAAFVVLAVFGRRWDETPFSPLGQ
jgi:hypothetical protein